MSSVDSQQPASPWPRATMPQSLNDSSLLTPPTRFAGELPKTSVAVDRKWQTQYRFHFKQLRGSAASYRVWPLAPGPLRSSAKLPKSPDLSPAFRADFQLALRRATSLDIVERTGRAPQPDCAPNEKYN